MTPAHKQAAEHALYDCNVISVVLRTLAKANISLGEAIDGTTIAWLAEQLDKALQTAEEAVEARRPI